MPAAGGSVVRRRPRSLRFGSPPRPGGRPVGRRPRRPGPWLAYRRTTPSHADLRHLPRPDRGPRPHRRRDGPRLPPGVRGAARPGRPGRRGRRVRGGRARAHRRAVGRLTAGRPIRISSHHRGPTMSLSIRLSTASDTGALSRLAALDDAAPPSGRALIAERDGVAVAAVTLTS